MTMKITKMKVCVAALAAAVSLGSVLPANAIPRSGPAGRGMWRSGNEVRLDHAKDPAALEASRVDTAPVSAGLPGDGSNDLRVDTFGDGDIIVGFDAWSVGHTGIADASRTISLLSKCIWSAVKESPGCVLLEMPLKYRGYDYAFGLWVPSATQYQRTSSRRFCSMQIGEPYDLFSSKTDLTRWYCSKLPWAGYSDRASKDLDANGGYWVTPADVYNDGDTRVFVSAN